MYNNKKGISDVVSTVLIILLVVAAVAIIGAIIINVVGKSGAGVNSAVACQQLQLKPTGCTKSTGVAFAQLNALPSGATLTSVNFVYGVTSTGATTVFQKGSSLSTVGATETVDATDAAFDTVSVGANITLSDGSKTVCAPTTDVVACV